MSKSSSIAPQDAGFQPVANPPYWASKAAVSLNLTIPPGTIQLGHPPQLRLPRKSRKPNGVVERWNRTLKEQAVYGRGFLNLADVRAAVAEFVERYNQWKLGSVQYRS